MEAYTCNDQFTTKDPKGDANCSSVMSAFSALHLLRYNHLLAHPGTYTVEFAYYF